VDGTLYEILLRQSLHDLLFFYFNIANCPVHLEITPGNLAPFNLQVKINSSFLVSFSCFINLYFIKSCMRLFYLL